MLNEPLLIIIIIIVIIILTQKSQKNKFYFALKIAPSHGTLYVFITLAIEVTNHGQACSWLMNK